MVALLLALIVPTDLHLLFLFIFVKKGPVNQLLLMPTVFCYEETAI